MFRCRFLHLVATGVLMPLPPQAVACRERENSMEVLATSPRIAADAAGSFTCTTGIADWLLTTRNNMVDAVFTLNDAEFALSQQVSMLRISKEEPALVIDWDVEAVGALVARANALVTAPAVPDWLTTARPPNITTTSLIGDLVRHLAQFGGGHCGRVVLAPNDMGQYTRLVLELSAVEAHPFLQAAIAGAPTGQRIATTYFMLDHQINQSIPIGRRRSSPARQLFA